MVELPPVKMKALPGPDAENICCHLIGVILRHPAGYWSHNAHLMTVSLRSCIILGEIFADLIVLALHLLIMWWSH